MSFPISKVAYTRASYGLFAFIMAGMAFLLYESNANRLDAHRWVAHTQNVLHSLNETSDYARRMFTNQALFLLMGDESYVNVRNKRYEEARAAIDRTMALTADNAVQQQRLENLKKWVQYRFVAMEEATEMRRSGDLEGVRRIMTVSAPEKETLEIDALVQELKAEELRLLTSRQSD